MRALLNAKPFCLPSEDVPFRTAVNIEVRMAIRMPLLQGDLDGEMTTQAATDCLHTTNIMPKVSQALSTVLTKKPRNPMGSFIAVLLDASEGSELVLLGAPETDASHPDSTEALKTLLCDNEKLRDANAKLSKQSELVHGQLEASEHVNKFLRNRLDALAHVADANALAHLVCARELEERLECVQDETQLVHDWTIGLDAQIDVLVVQIDELVAQVESRDTEISSLKLYRDELIAQSEEDLAEQNMQMDRLGNDNLKLKDIVLSKQSQFDQLNTLAQMKATAQMKEMAQMKATESTEIKCLKRVLEEMLTYVRNMDDILDNRRLQASTGQCDMCSKTDEEKMSFLELEMQAAHKQLIDFLGQMTFIFEPFWKEKFDQLCPKDQKHKEAGARRKEGAMAEPAVQLCDNVGCNVVLSAPISHCSKCKNVFYCTKACQTQAWKAGHNRECVQAKLSTD